MNVLAWNSDMRLELPRLDMAHQAFLDQLCAMEGVDDQEFHAAFARLVARVEADFREEDDLMDEIDYPGVNVHREHHARILGALHQVSCRVMNGDIAVGREALALLPHWFMLHLSTMDMALALALEFHQSDAALAHDARQ